MTAWNQFLSASWGAAFSPYRSLTCSVWYGLRFRNFVQKLASKSAALNSPLRPRMFSMMTAWNPEISAEICPHKVCASTSQSKIFFIKNKAYLKEVWLRALFCMYHCSCSIELYTSTSPSNLLREALHQSAARYVNNSIVVIGRVQSLTSLDRGWIYRNSFIILKNQT